MTPSWEHRVGIARGSRAHGLVNAGGIERALAEEEAEGWELESALPVTQLGLTSAVWRLFKRPLED